MNLIWPPGHIDALELGARLSEQAFRRPAVLLRDLSLKISNLELLRNHCICHLSALLGRTRSKVSSQAPSTIELLLNLGPPPPPVIVYDGGRRVHTQK